MKKPLAGRDTGSIQSLNLKNGDILHVGNQDANMASVAEAQASSGPVVNTLSNMIDTTDKGKASTTTSDKPKPGASGKTARCNHISTQKCVHCMSAATEEGKGEEGKEGEQAAEPKLRCNHASSSKCPNCIGATGSVMKAKMTCHHASNIKCPNCMNEDEGMIADRKHDPFDGFIAKQKKKCAKSHASNQKCQNCTFSQDQRYTVDYNCKFHPPYP